MSAAVLDERLTGAAGAIVDLWLGNRLTIDWRDRLDESDFLQSDDWARALEYATAVLAYLDAAKEDPSNG